MVRKGEALARRARRALRLAAVIVAAAIALAPSHPAAHEIPADVLVQMFVKPDGQKLRVLVRLPLAAMRDVEFPLRGGTGLLDLARADLSIQTAASLWIANDLAIYEQDTRLRVPKPAAARVSIPSDRSFVDFDQALAHVTGPALPPDTTLYWNQALLDVLFEYPISSDQSRFSMHPALARLGLRVVTVLRFLPPDGPVRAFEYVGDPGLVRLDPRWHQAAWQFIKLGFAHILSGFDHLLFVFCLVIPFRRFRQLVIVVTAFTIAHSITLIASAFGLGPTALWFPPLIETLIATSILYMALENIVLSSPGAPPSGGRLAASRSAVASPPPPGERPAASGSAVVSRGVHLQRRWMIAFAFGLVHGFGFSFALRETLQFAGSHLLTSLLSFNAGVELGQLLVLALLVPALQLLFRFVVSERVGTIILSAFVAHTAWHWVTERFEVLRQFSFPALDAATLVLVLRWLMALVLIAGIAWLVRGRVRKGTGENVV